MATNLSSCFPIQCLEQLVKFLVNFTLLKYVKSQRSYGFLITKELIFGFQILNLKDHSSDSLNENAVLTLTFKVPRIVKHGVKSSSKIRPSRKKEFNKLDEFNLGVVRRMPHQFYARGEITFL